MHFEKNGLTDSDPVTGSAFEPGYDDDTKCALGLTNTLAFSVMFLFSLIVIKALKLFGISLVKYTSSFYIIHILIKINI